MASDPLRAEVEVAEEATDESSATSSVTTSPQNSSVATSSPDESSSGEYVSGSASHKFIDSLAGQVNQEDVYNMIVSQREMLARLEKSNEMLGYCNMLANQRYLTSLQEFKRHTHVLQDTKKQLDLVFKRIRGIKKSLSKQYPEAFTHARSSVILSPDSSDKDVDARFSEEPKQPADNSQDKKTDS